MAWVSGVSLEDLCGLSVFVCFAPNTGKCTFFMLSGVCGFATYRVTLTPSHK